MTSGSPQALQQIGVYCRANGIQIAVEVAAVEVGATGDGVYPEGAAPIGTTAAWVSKAQQYGLPVKYVTIDECLLVNQKIYHWSLDDLAHDVANSVRIVQSAFPGAVIGEDEPASISPSTLQSWLTAYTRAVGRPLGYFDADVGWNGTAQDTWLRSLETLSSLLVNNGVPLGLLLNGSAEATSASEWTASAESHLAAVAADPAISLTSIAVQTWDAYPQFTVSPVNPGSLSSVALATTLLYPLYRAGAISGTNASTLRVAVPGLTLLPVGMGSPVSALQLTISNPATADRYGIVLTDGVGTLSASSSGAGTVAYLGAHALALTGSYTDLVAELQSLRIEGSSAGSDTLLIETFGASGRIDAQQAQLLFVPEVLISAQQTLAHSQAAQASPVMPSNGSMTVTIDTAGNKSDYVYTLTESDQPWSQAIVTADSSGNLLHLRYVGKTSGSSQLQIYVADVSHGLQSVLPYLAANNTLDRPLLAKSIDMSFDPDSHQTTEETDSFFDGTSRSVLYSRATGVIWSSKIALYDSAGGQTWNLTTYKSGAVLQSEQLLDAATGTLTAEIDSLSDGSKNLLLYASAAGLPAGETKEIKHYDSVTGIVSQDSSWMTDGSHTVFDYDPSGAEGWLWKKHYYDTSARLIHLDIDYQQNSTYAYSNIFYDGNGSITQQYDVYAAGGYVLTVNDTQGTRPWTHWVANVAPSGVIFKQIYYRPGESLAEVDQTLLPGATVPTVSTAIEPSGARVTETLGSTADAFATIDDLYNAQGQRYETDISWKTGPYTETRETYDLAAGKVQYRYDTPVTGGGYVVTVYDTKNDQPWASWIAAVDAAGNVQKRILIDKGQSVVEIDQTLVAGATVPSVSTSIYPTGAKLSQAFVSTASVWEIDTLYNPSGAKTDVLTYFRSGILSRNELWLDPVTAATKVAIDVDLHGRAAATDNIGGNKVVLSVSSFSGADSLGQTFSTASLTGGMSFVQNGVGADTVTITTDNAGGNSVMGGAVGSLTVIDRRGGNTISGGAGGLSMTASAGGDMVTTNGRKNTVILGVGTDTIVANGATKVSPNSASLLLSGDGDVSVNGGTGSITFSGGSGLAYIFTQNGTKNSLALGAGKANVVSHGADTITAGAGPASVYAGGAALINGGSGTLAVNGRDGAITVNGSTGTLRASAGTGGGYIKGGSNGGNVLNASAGNTTLVGGGNGDALIDSSVSGVVTLMAGPGSETLTGGLARDLFVVTKSGSPHAVVIRNFSADNDHLQFAGFNSASPIIAQSTVGNNLQLTLVDNSKITLVGLSNLASQAIV